MSHFPQLRVSRFLGLREPSSLKLAYQKVCWGLGVVVGWYSRQLEVQLESRACIQKAPDLFLCLQLAGTLRLLSVPLLHSRTLIWIFENSTFIYLDN